MSCKLTIGVARRVSDHDSRASCALCSCGLARRRLPFQLGRTYWKSMAMARAGLPAGSLLELVSFERARRSTGGTCRARPDRRRSRRTMRAGVPEIYQAKVAELSARYDLSPALIEALVWQESRWRADARLAGRRARAGPTDARHRPRSGREPGRSASPIWKAGRDICANSSTGSTAIWNWRWPLIMPGRAALIRAGGIPHIRETQHYVAAIMGRLSNHSRE